MKTLVKLALVSALVSIFMPCSRANELVPPDIIRTLEAGYFVEAVSGSQGPTNISKNMKADNSKTMADAKRGAPPVQHSTLNELLPPDIIRELETGYFIGAASGSPDSSGPTDISENIRADNPTTMTNARRGAITPVQHPTLNELLPSDIMRTRVLPVDP